METIKGYIEHIVYRNAENGYTVMDVDFDGELVTCVGSFQMISEGEYMAAQGEHTEHPVYGEQFQVKSYQIQEPEDAQSFRRYLASGAVKGIGIKMAERIVKKFGDDTMRIMEEEPERLAEVKGISMKKAMEIADQLSEKRDMRKAMLFLQKFGISNNLAVKIYNTYGDDLYEIMNTNPYKLADDIAGVGFKIADEIAAKSGIQQDSDFRIQSGIQYVLQLAGGNGHVCLPMEDTKQQAANLLGVEEESLDNAIMDLAMDKKITIKQNAKDESVKMVYLSRNYFMELSTAKMLQELNVQMMTKDENTAKTMQKLEAVEHIELDEKQRLAVLEAVHNGIFILTGGPGTGKTTTINAIIKYFELEGLDILLAAPTGRAAKRMTEATGYEAQTIHRMLEIDGSVESENSGAKFQRNEQNPLEADVVIIDEMSMVDIFLMNALLRAIQEGTRLILVGDINQLPSVGPGNVLRDMIASGKFPIVMLTKIFRQASLSDIVVNAHKIQKGEKVALDNNSKDFLFLKREEPSKVINAMITLIREKLPAYVQADKMEIQVLTPMRKGMLGVERLNQILQEYINPPSEQKREKEINGNIFREGDKVMQIKNNYQMEWKVLGKNHIVVEKGIGIFNGDVGVICSMNTYSETMDVEFEDGRRVEYSFKQTDELELAYAITIHKSQGSEYPAVVLPMLGGPRMLMNRNLLYTAVTRARKCVCVVGMKESFDEMVCNVNEMKRHSGLTERLQELDI